MGRMEILTGRERRRYWSDEQKLVILAEASEDGISAAVVARRHDLAPQQIYAWRRQFKQAGASEARLLAPPTFLPVALAPDLSGSGRTEGLPPADCRCAHSVEIGLAKGWTLRVASDIEAEALRSLVRALEGA